MLSIYYKMILLHFNLISRDCYNTNFIDKTDSEKLALSKKINYSSILPFFLILSIGYKEHRILSLRLKYKLLSCGLNLIFYCVS